MSTSRAPSVHFPPFVRKIRIIKKVHSDLVLGSPSSGCQGVGICHMVNIDHETSCKCPRVPAQVGLSEHGRLRIYFQKGRMDARCIKKHFSWGLFQVMEPYSVPEFVSKALSITGYTIQPGIYPAWESDDNIIVDF